MTPSDQFLALYKGKDDLIGEDFAAHLRHGYVIARPEFILLGRVVRRDWSDEQRRNPRVSCSRETGDAWFVWAAAGDLRQILAAIPFPMPWVGWARRGVVRWYSWEQIASQLGK